MYVAMSHVCVYTCAHEWRYPEARRVQSLWGWRYRWLWAVCMGVGNWARVFWKSRVCCPLLSLCPSCWLSLTKPTDKSPAHLAFHDLHPCVLVTPCGFQTPRSPSLTQDWQTTSLVVLTCLVPLAANVGANVGTQSCALEYFVNG